VIVAVVFIAAVGGFLLAPHLAIAATIPLFAFLPALKVFAGASVGPLKDVVSLAAICAAVLLVIFERRFRADPITAVAVALLLGLYLVNLGGGHGIAWAQGVRLIGEPLLLLLTGMMLGRPRRTLNFAMGSLGVTACIAALYGLFQQYLGPATLVSLGYSYSLQVRSFNGVMRSFGTFDDPFIYAAFLLFGLVAVAFWMRRGWLSYASATLLVGGVAVSFVRTAALTTAALAALLLARRGHGASAALLLAASVIAAATILATARGTESRTLRASGSVVTLNGRISAWKAALGGPGEWAVGQGVGKVGTAAQRAAFTISPARGTPTLPPNARAVDSGYLATIADVGLAGLAVLLVLLGRLGFLAWRAIRRRDAAGWVAAGVLGVFLLDAVTRASFTGYPTAFLGFLLIGVSLAAARDEPRAML
jgi:hypothetical protein